MEKDEKALIESDITLLDPPTTNELAAEKKRAAIENSNRALRALGIDPATDKGPPPPDYAENQDDRPTVPAIMPQDTASKQKEEAVPNKEGEKPKKPYISVYPFPDQWGESDEAAIEYFDRHWEAAKKKQGQPSFNTDPDAQEEIL